MQEIKDNLMIGFIKITSVFITFPSLNRCLKYSFTRVSNINGLKKISNIHYPFILSTYLNIESQMVNVWFINFVSGVEYLTFEPNLFSN